MLPVRAHHLTHIDTLSAEVAGQAGTPGAGPLDADRDDVAMAAQPSPQLPVASRGRWERSRAEQTAYLVERGCNVNVLVRVDTAEHATRVGRWLCHRGHRHPFMPVVDGTHSRSRTGQ
jgi:hypothetical protein